jgi:low affinity Fe/Cu permease
MPTPLRPSDVDPHLSWFDRLSTAIADTVARAWFFCACVVVVLVWAPSYWLLRDLNTWQLIINTLTTIVTFLLVALLQNTQSRDNRALHRKLNAIADALADFMEENATSANDLCHDLNELRAAVGLEHREGS